MKQKMPDEIVFGAIESPYKFICGDHMADALSKYVKKTHNKCQ